MEQVSTNADMKTLADCINKVQADGYTENFKMSEQGLLSLQNERLYHPEDITVKNFYRFEGISDPADNSILYAIETNDGVKGLLTDAYGPYADPEVTRFMEEVEEIHKKKVNP
ncbi:MAG TPA: hypothetical protein VFX58_13460 [Chitinophagaceae bacterium]|nr:hypothetical protein [Chitinophagaceae bacterium]